MESTIHPSQVHVGDILTVLYKGFEIDVQVTTEPEEDSWEDSESWWTCNIKSHEGPNEWYATWNEETKVWEVGE